MTPFGFIILAVATFLTVPDTSASGVPTRSARGAEEDVVTNKTGNLFVPKTPEVFKYDADGNLTNDGRWSYSWDAENRLVTMTANTDVPSSAKLKLDLTYDYRNRRITKRVSTWNGSSYVAAYTNKFLYDGWNLIAELNQTNGVVRTFLWGTDLSGDMQDAGGVGGLLAVTVTTNGTHFPAFDGNGNVSALLSASSATQTAAFDFGPFGEVIRAEGTGASSCPVRFSTKYQDPETDLLYYGERYYCATTGRWVSRDPIEEIGGLNVYGFVGNDAIGGVDSDGRVIFKPQAEMQRYFARQLKNFAAGSRSPLLGGAAGTLASLYEASANVIDPSLSDYLDRTLRRYDNAGRVYDRERGRCGERKLWAAYAAGAYFLGDYFGLNGLPEGIYGVDLITEQSLSTSERWSRGLSGASSTILFAATALSGVSAANRPFGSTAARSGGSDTSEIALGLSRHPSHTRPGLLGRFADHVNAKYYRQWEQAGIATSRGGNLMEPSFIQQALNKADKIHFNLDGFSRTRYQEFLKNPSFSYGNVTNWELHQIMKNPSLLNKTTFYGPRGVITPAPSF